MINACIFLVIAFGVMHASAMDGEQVRTLKVMFPVIRTPDQAAIDVFDPTTRTVFSVYPKTRDPGRFHDYIVPSEIDGSVAVFLSGGTFENAWWYALADLRKNIQETKVKLPSTGAKFHFAFPDDIPLGNPDLVVQMFKIAENGEIDPLWNVTFPIDKLVKRNHLLELPLFESGKIIVIVNDASNRKNLYSRMLDVKDENLIRLDPNAEEFSLSMEGSMIVEVDLQKKSSMPRRVQIQYASRNKVVDQIIHVGANGERSVTVLKQ